MLLLSHGNKLPAIKGVPDSYLIIMVHIFRKNKNQKPKPKQDKFKLHKYVRLGGRKSVQYHQGISYI